MKKLTNKKGFTLIEMLIVIAIIVILVAIAVPSFSSSLDKANQATDEANFRTAQSLTAAKAVDYRPDTTEYYFLNIPGTSDSITETELTLLSSKEDTSGINTEDEGVSDKYDGQHIIVTIETNGKTSVEWSGSSTTEE